MVKKIKSTTNFCSFELMIVKRYSYNKHFCRHYFNNLAILLFHFHAIQLEQSVIDEVSDQWQPRLAAGGWESAMAPVDSTVNSCLPEILLCLLIEISFSTSLFFICPIAIAYNMWQIIKSVASVSLSVCVSVRLRALSRSYFLIDFHQNWHKCKNPQK